MHVNRSESMPVTGLSSSAAQRPLITFNYLPLNPIAFPLQSKPSLPRPPSSTTYGPNYHPEEKILLNAFSQQSQGQRDSRRKKIFTGSHSSNDFFGLSRGASHEHYQHWRQSAENRELTESNELKNKSQRKRNNIFQSYHAKAKLSPQTHSPTQQNSSHTLPHPTSGPVFPMAFQRPAHPKKLTNYLQLTPNRIARRTQQQVAVILPNAESYISKIPLRNTYVAQRDWEATPIAQTKEASASGILEKELYQIPLHKMEESFTKKVQPEHIMPRERERQHPVHNLQFEEESINGYSHRQLHPQEDPLEDMPELMLETHQHKSTFKHDKLEQIRPRVQSSSLVDVRLLHTSHSQHSQVVPKDLASSCQPVQKASQDTVKRSGLESIPYLLVALGMLLLIIQLLK